MITPKVSIIVSITGKNRSIGNEGKLIAPISADLKRFKELTMGHPIIMGRKTFESIGRALPGRPNFVITRNPDFRSEGVTVCTSLPEAIEKAREKETAEIFIIGGGEIYTQALPFTDRIYLTIVKSGTEGDVFFPDYKEFTKETFREERVDEKSGLAYNWVNLEK